MSLDGGALTEGPQRSLELAQNMSRPLRSPCVCTLRQDVNVFAYLGMIGSVAASVRSSALAHGIAAILGGRLILRHHAKMLMMCHGGMVACVGRFNDLQRRSNIAALPRQVVQIPHTRPRLLTSWLPRDVGSEAASSIFSARSCMPCSQQVVQIPQHSGQITDDSGHARMVWSVGHFMISVLAHNISPSSRSPRSDSTTPRLRGLRLLTMVGSVGSLVDLSTRQNPLWPLARVPAYCHDGQGVVETRPLTGFGALSLLSCLRRCTSLLDAPRQPAAISRLAKPSRPPHFAAAVPGQIRAFGRAQSCRSRRSATACHRVPG